MKFNELCEEYGLNQAQCTQLLQIAKKECPTPKEKPQRTSERKPKRKLSKWQICIKEKMSGKPFNPQKIKELSKLYNQGKCPTPEYLEKMRVGEEG